MKTIAIVIVAILTASCAQATSLLEQAILELPPKAVAGVSTDNRQRFIDDVKKCSSPGIPDLDIKNDYFKFSSDNTEDKFSNFKTPHYPTSMFYVKLFWIKNGGYIVVCCIPFPTVQIFVYKRQNQNWLDVTNQYIPVRLNKFSYAKMCRTRNLIEVGTDDSRSNGYSNYGRQLDLHWNGKTFVVVKPSSWKYTDVWL